MGRSVNVYLQDTIAVRISSCEARQGVLKHTALFITISGIGGGHNLPHRGSRFSLCPFIVPLCSTS